MGDQDFLSNVGEKDFCILQGNLKNRELESDSTNCPVLISKTVIKQLSCKGHHTFAYHRNHFTSLGPTQSSTPATGLPHLTAEESCLQSAAAAAAGRSCQTTPSGDFNRAGEMTFLQIEERKFAEGAKRTCSFLYPGSGRNLFSIDND